VGAWNWGGAQFGPRYRIGSASALDAERLHAT
jgi:hypothetical protein